MYMYMHILDGAVKSGTTNSKRQPTPFRIRRDQSNLDAYYEASPDRRVKALIACSVPVFSVEQRQLRYWQLAAINRVGGLCQRSYLRQRGIDSRSS
jgi:hypothetical protein